MTRSLLAPQAPFNLPLEVDTNFSTYNVGTGIFPFAVMAMGDTAAQLQLLTASGSSGWTFEIAPLKLFVFEIPPSVTGFWVQSDSSIHAYFPGRDY